MQGLMTQTGPVSLRRWGLLMFGLTSFGLGVVLMFRANAGLGPWDVLHQGLHLRSGLTVGTVSILTGLAVMLCWIPLGERPGPATLLNILWIGIAVDLLMPLVPEAPGPFLGLVQATLGVVLMGVSTGIYLSPRLGSGPRDGLMLGLARKTGWSIRLIRTLIELSVLLVGWLLGGKIGAGTLIFALGIGPVAQATLEWMKQFTQQPAQ